MTLTTMPLMLAETARRATEREQQQLVTQLIVLFAILVAAVIITGVVVFIVRRRALREDSPDSRVPLTLSDARRMHHAGEIDEKEYARLRQVVTTQTGGGLMPATTPVAPEPPAPAPAAPEEKADDEPHTPPEEPTS